MTIGKAPLLAVVDDVAEVRIALTRLVSSAGFEVEAFDSGAAFLQSLDDHEPDCVLLDLHMPPPRQVRDSGESSCPWQVRSSRESRSSLDTPGSERGMSWNRLDFCKRIAVDPVVALRLLSAV